MRSRRPVPFDPWSTAIAMLGTYPPTQCGLATFGAALMEHLLLSAGSLGVVRVVDEPAPRPEPDVVAHLVNGSAESARAAVQELNCFDVVIVQHEYGIYGGPDGADVLGVVDALTVPTIIVLHTVLEDPTARQRRILLRLLVAADIVVTMTETARQRLIMRYGADDRQIVVIPHGAIDNGHLDRSAGAVRTAEAGEHRPLIRRVGGAGRA
jgi:polysaccharide biosynthesis protein PslF